MTGTMTRGSKGPLNVAVVGLGFMGMTHLRVYLDHPLARVAAVCGRTRLPVDGVLTGVAGNIQESEGVRLNPEVKVFREFEALLAEPNIDVVDLCTPTPFHAEQAMAALRAGKHVLCEKPLARTSAAAREISRVAAESPGVLMPAMCIRFWPGWAFLKQVVQEQRYGRVLAAGFRRLSERPGWSGEGIYAAGGDSGGALYDLHIHDTDFIHALFGRPASVCSTGVVGAGGAVDHVLTHYHYSEGPVVHAEGSWLLAGGFHMGYTVHCERATLDFDLSRGAEALRATEAGQEPRTVTCEGPDGYAGEINYLLECVLHGRPPQTVTAWDAVAALEICEAEEQSIHSGSPVRLTS